MVRGEGIRLIWKGYVGSFCSIPKIPIWLILFAAQLVLGICCGVCCVVSVPWVRMTYVTRQNGGHERTEPWISLSHMLFVRTWPVPNRRSINTYFKE